MEQVQIDPSGKGLILLPGGRQRLHWPRSCQEYSSYVDRWRLEPSVAAAALILGEWSSRVLGLDLWIISGYRTPERQRELQRRPEGRPVASPCSSCHVRNPSLAFDVGFDFAPSQSHYVTLGQRARELGLRAGVFFAAPDVNHFDAGPC